MTMRVSALWRHPIKSHGREALAAVDVQAGQTMPWDRRWAVAHEAAQPFAGAWMPCRNFSIGAKAPALTAITAEVDEARGRVTLRHPERADLTIDPDQEGDALIDWVRPLMPENRAQSVKVVRVPERGMTDTDFPSLSLLNEASNAALAEAAGTDVSMLRWRGNIHLSGLAAWAEADLIGQRLLVGAAELLIREPIVRCLATTANPATGERDLDTLAFLKELTGVQNFGIYAEVVQSGRIALGDEVRVL